MSTFTSKFAERKIGPKFKELADPAQDVQYKPRL